LGVVIDHRRDIPDAFLPLGPHAAGFFVQNLFRKSVKSFHLIRKIFSKKMENDRFLENVAFRQ